MAKPGLLHRLAQPRSLAAIFAVIMGFVAITAIPAEARRHGYRHYARYHAYHHHFAQRRVASVPARGYRLSSSRGGGEAIIGEHRGFAAIVVDANTGRTLYARNENELRHPASVTKVMTLYLLFEQLEKGRLRLDSPLMISAHAAAQAPSKLGLAPGETISVENAIKALVTKSANDIACAVAENVGGSEAAFARMMTSKAHALGMTRTHYENASGLPNPEQVTTAADLAVLGRAIQDRFPRYYRYFSTHSFAYNGALHRNHNHLLGQVEGMDGIKTGYTRASGFNLLTSVRRKNHHIVAVVMGGVTAGARDRTMAGLIEDHIYGGASMRTAEAISEGPSTDEARPMPIAPTRIARAETTAEEPAAETEAEAPAPRLFQATPHAPQRMLVVDPEPVGATLARAQAAGAASEKVERPASVAHAARTVTPVAGVRPAFVSGLQKQVAAPIAARTEGRKATAARAKSEPVVADGSTTSRVAKSREAALPATTPPAIRAEPLRRSAAVETGRPARAGWMIQIGAAENPEKANLLLARARDQLQGFPTQPRAFTEKVQRGGETLYRARFAGMEAQSAETACRTLKRSGFDCFTTRN
jgi:D-alanyl-D-alanine carboxypeptidase